MSYTIKIETGAYTGNGTVQNINGCDGPDLVFTKRINGADTAMYALWKDIPRNQAMALSTSASVKANQITDLTRDGFAVGAGQSQNTADYIWLGIKSLGDNTYFKTGRYVGNAADNRNMTGGQGCRFTPDLLVVCRHVDGQPQSHRTSEHVGDLSGTFANAAVANYIQSFISGGFQLGSNANVNNSADYFDWFAMRQIPGGMKVGSYTGNATARSIEVGFAPDFLIVKNQDTADVAWIRESSMSISLPMNVGATNTEAITALTTTGFTVGNLAAVNGNENKIHYIAFKNGEYTPSEAR